MSVGLPWPACTHVSDIGWPLAESSSCRISVPYSQRSVTKWLLAGGPKLVVVDVYMIRLVVANALLTWLAMYAVVSAGIVAGDAVAAATPTAVPAAIATAVPVATTARIMRRWPR